MDAYETSIFQLLDRFARAEFLCKVTEFFQSTERDDLYIVCFRPLSVGNTPDKQRLCCYIEIVASEATKSIRAKLLTDEIVGDMRKGLNGLFESAQ